MRRFVNAAWFVEALLPNLFLASVLTTAALLFERRQGGAALVAGPLGAALGVVAAAVAFWQARRHFISAAEARVKIESGLHLHSRLSAAAAGVGPWPSAAQWSGRLWRWHWRRLAALPLCSALLLLAALLIPFAPNTAETKPPVALPPALEKALSMLEKLAATPELDQASVEALREEAEQLVKQEPAEWYSHASLEAADHLKGKLQAGLKTLYDQAARMEKLLGQFPGEAGAPWNEQLQGAFSALQGNVPGLNHDLSKVLSGLDPSKLKTISPEQLEALKEGLRDVQKAAKDGKGEAEGRGEGEEAQEGQGAGKGGVNEGPGTAPVQLGQPANLGTKKTETLANEDNRRPALGDAVGMSAGQHDIDKNKEHCAAEGGAAAAGEGAGAVWQQQHVTPEERKRLQQFFR